jgi:hypothetical protein
LNLGAGLTTSGGNLVPDFATTSTAGKVVQANDARLPSSTCASGNKNRWDGSAWVCETDSDTGASGVSTNTPNTLVMRDGSGNFAAGTITANLTRNVTGNVTGNVSGTAANVTGTVAVANGGTGTTNGSITGTGALTFAAGGTNQNVTLTPSGTGQTILNGNVGIGVSLPSSYGVRIAKDTMYFTNAAGNVDYLYADGTGRLSIASSSGAGSRVGIGGSVTIGAAYVPVAAPSEGLLVQGNVGIGQTSANATLDVNGTIKSVATSNAGTTIDFATGNLQYTSQSCGAMTLNNMKSGTAYNLAVQGAAGGTCAFSAYSDVATTALTVKSVTGAMTQTAAKHVVFTFLVMGSYVYVSAVDGL